MLDGGPDPNVINGELPEYLVSVLVRAKTTKARRGLESGALEVAGDTRGLDRSDLNPPRARGATEGSRGGGAHTKDDDYKGGTARLRERRARGRRRYARARPVRPEAAARARRGRGLAASLSAPGDTQRTSDV